MKKQIIIHIVLFMVFANCKSQLRNEYLQNEQNLVLTILKTNSPMTTHCDSIAKACEQLYFSELSSPIVQLIEKELEKIKIYNSTYPESTHSENSCMYTILAMNTLLYSSKFKNLHINDVADTLVHLLMIDTISNKSEMDCLLNHILLRFNYNNKKQFIDRLILDKNRNYSLVNYIISSVKDTAELLELTKYLLPKIRNTNQIEYLSLLYRIKTLIYFSDLVSIDIINLLKDESKYFTDTNDNSMIQWNTKILLELNTLEKTYNEKNTKIKIK